MRYRVLFIVGFIMALSQVQAQDPYSVEIWVYGAFEDQDPRVYTAIERIIRESKFTGETADQVRDALTKAAGQDSAVKNALIFAAETTDLFQFAYNSYNDLLYGLSRENSGNYWKSLRTLGSLYRGNGVLSAVRYQTMTNRVDLQWLCSFDREFFSVENEPAVSGFLNLYNDYRRRGYRPDEAYGFVLYGDHKDVGRGQSLIYKQLLDLGRWSLTGYSPKDAERDLAGFLEAYYAYLYPDAKDIKGVTPALCPLDHMSHKIMEGMKQDMDHMLIPVRKIVNAVAYPDRGNGPLQSNPRAAHGRTGTGGGGADDPFLGDLRIRDR